MSGWLRFLCGALPTTFRATTAHVSGLRTARFESGIIDPETGLKALGLPIGFIGESRSGGLFGFDEFEFYRIGVVKSLNAIVVGEVGNWKSSSLKFLTYLSSIAGYNTLVTDMKGEWSELLPVIPGSLRIRIRPSKDQKEKKDFVQKEDPGTTEQIFLNAIDPAFDRATQRRLLTELVLVCMGGGREHLTTEESRVLWEGTLEAKRLASEEGRVAVLPDLVELLFDNPTEGMCTKLRMTEEEIKMCARPMAQGLQRMTDEDGDLFGIFHLETTHGLFEPRLLLIMDCEDLEGDELLVAAMLISFISRVLNKRGKKRFHRFIFDESWKLAANASFVESLRAGEKFGGSEGAAYWIVAHSLTNFYESKNEAGIKDIIGDSEIKFIFAQSLKDLDASQKDLQITDTEKKIIANLDPGHCLLKIGRRRGILLEFDAWPEILKALETRGLIRGQSKAFGAVQNAKG